MQNLSAGLRSCACFAKITYICPHLLIMDEPTNFLDLESIDSLILATNKYHGALLLVSHNRLFLNKCAKQYLSVVPGRFEVFGDLKTCERATYQFIEEMESGVKVGAQDLVAKNPSADAALSVRTGEAAKKAAAEKAASEGVMSISSASKPADSKGEGKGLDKKSEIKEIKAAKPEGNLVGRKCTAVWAADGGKYSAVVLKVINDDEIEVVYTGYNESAIVKLSSVTFNARAPASHAAPKSGGGRHGGNGGGGRQGGGQGHANQQNRGAQRQQRQSRSSQPSGPARQGKARRGSERE